MPTPSPTPSPAPHTLEAYRLQYPIPAGDYARMGGGQKFAVYCGPGEGYVRGGKGKASVSTNGWVYCYGRTGDWYLIEYEVNQGGNRRGYIHAPGGVGIAVGDLPCAGYAVRFTAEADLTDDPHYSRRVLAAAPAGSEAELLFFDGDDAFVDMTIARKRYRGYVPIAVLELAE